MIPIIASTEPLCQGEYGAQKKTFNSSFLKIPSSIGRWLWAVSLSTVRDFRCAEGKALKIWNKLLLVVSASLLGSFLSSTHLAFLSTATKRQPLPPRQETIKSDSKCPNSALLSASDERYLSTFWESVPLSLFLAPEARLFLFVLPHRTRCLIRVRSLV